MPRWSRWATNDDGSAALEFITVGVILLVPLVYLIVALGVIQEQTLGVEAAARHTARVVALAPDAATAEARSQRVLAGIIDEYGLAADAVEVSMTCSPAGAECPSAGSTIIVTIGTRVGLPLMPPIFGLDRAVAIPVEASAVQKVSRLWGDG
ncbi:TadE family protein [Microbacterium sp. SD291]|uniref:TadE family protein n=1 Tax=Microbacterium sp. SD291 TaxID=2782007 RepID=UPI001A96D63C|nr:TadE family protein [Microbacterium sp. SD291]MBO0982104.1 TadE family protein [Microbacterium sp. SD291]